MTYSEMQIGCLEDVNTSTWHGVSTVVPNVALDLRSLTEFVSMVVDDVTGGDDGVRGNEPARTHHPGRVTRVTEPGLDLDNG